MANVFRLVFILMAIAAASAALGQGDDGQLPAQAEDARTISVTVRFVLPDEDAAQRDEGGFPELPFSLYARTDPLKFEEIGTALGDSEGIVHFESVEVPDEYERVVFGWHNFWDSSHYDRDALREFRERYNTVGQSYYWPYLCRECVALLFDLRTNIQTYELQLKLHRSVTLTGGVERAGGGPLQRAPVWARLANSRNNTNLNGRIPGLVVPKGAPNEVFVRDFPVITSRLVRREETLANTSLGLISIPFMERSVEFDGILKHMLEFREQRWRNAERSPGSPGVTIISEDGKVILTWMTGVVGPHGSERLTEEWEVPIYAPPGTYYVAPSRPLSNGDRGGFVGHSDHGRSRFHFKRSA